MVKECSIVSCKSIFIAGNGITFHRLPTNDEDLKKKWIDAVPTGLLKNVTKNTFICSLHFILRNYHTTPTGRNFLKKGSIPTLFKVLPHNDPEKNNKIMITDIDVNVDQEDMLKLCAEENMMNDFGNNRLTDKENTVAEETHKKADAFTQTYPKRLKTIYRETLMRRVDILQKRLRRRDARIGVMEDVIKTFEDETARSKDIRDMVKEHFSGDKLLLLWNEVNNSNVPPNRRQYSEDFKQFASTMYLHSTEAYELLKKYLYLPHPGTMRKWMTVNDCEPGAFTEDSNDLGVVQISSVQVQSVKSEVIIKEERETNSELSSTVM